MKTHCKICGELKDDNEYKILEFGKYGVAPFCNYCYECLDEYFQQHYLDTGKMGVCEDCEHRRSIP